MMLVCNIIERLLLSWFISSLMNVRKNKYIYQIFLATCSFLVIQISNMLNAYDLLLTFSCIVAIVIISLFFVDDHIFKIMFVACLESVFYSYISYICIFVNMIFESIDIDLLAKIVYFILAIPFIGLLKKKEIDFDKKTYLILSILLFSFQLVSSLVLQIYLVLDQRLNEILIIAVIYLISNALFLYIIFNLSYFNKTNREYDKLKQEKQNNLVLSQLYEEIKITKHDLKHEYQLYKHYLDHQQVDKLKEVINEKVGYIEELPKLLFCPNELINTIINNKIIEAYTKEIDILVNVSVKEIIPINDYDFNELLSNLLDNAIENTVSSIHLSIIQDNDYLHIKIENMYRGHFSTETKKDRKYHGFGMKSVKRICAKYHCQPYIQTDHQNYRFQASLYLG